MERSDLLLREFLPSLGITLYIAVVSSLLAVALGALCAAAICRTRSQALRTHFENLLRLPIVVPHIVVAFFMFHLLLKFRLVFDTFSVGVILAYVVKGFPFAAIVILAALRNFDKTPVEAARGLGAGRVRAWFDLVFPYLFRALRTCFILLFVFSFGAFEVPFLLGRTSPRTLPVMTYSHYISAAPESHDIAIALSIFISVVSLVVVAFVLREKE